MHGLYGGDSTTACMHAYALYAGVVSDIHNYMQSLICKDDTTKEVSDLVICLMQSVCVITYNNYCCLISPYHRVRLCIVKNSPNEANVHIQE